ARLAGEGQGAVGLRAGCGGDAAHDDGRAAVAGDEEVGEARVEGVLREGERAAGDGELLCQVLGVHGILTWRPSRTRRCCRSRARAWGRIARGWIDTSPTWLRGRG